jgi:acyl carrier protein
MRDDELKALIFAELKKVAPECDPAEVDPGENIREALDIDSYSFLKLLVGLCESTNIDIPEEDYEQVFTLGGMLRYLASHGA